MRPAAPTLLLRPSTDAGQTRRPPEEDCPDAERAAAAGDDLNAHDLGSFCEACDAATARRPCGRPRLAFTPRNGGRLNLSEAGLPPLSRRRVDRRFESAARTEAAVEAWRRRNASGAGANRRLTTERARVKPARLNPDDSPGKPDIDAEPQ